MVGTEFIKGQGLGNQLFCYIAARCAAERGGYEFGTAGQECFANNIHNGNGMYFMDIDLGKNISEEEAKTMKRVDDADTRLFLGTAKSDMERGIYISAADERILQVEDNTLIYGNMQAQAYFTGYEDKIAQWLPVKPEYDSDEYSRENLCIINMRGGEYANHPELYLQRRYWKNGIKQMRKIRPDMEFMIVTDDVSDAKKLLPGIPAYHFDMGKDYVTLKNAHYLLLSNSTFAFFPAITSKTVKTIIAPKYWARHNVSDGYWASEQNIYDSFMYMDRRGKLFTANQCREELADYKKRRNMAAKMQPATGLMRTLQTMKSKWIYAVFYARKVLLALGRRAGLIKE